MVKDKKTSLLDTYPNDLASNEAGERCDERMTRAKSEQTHITGAWNGRNSRA